MANFAIFSQFLIKISQLTIITRLKFDLNTGIRHTNTMKKGLSILILIISSLTVWKIHAITVVAAHPLTHDYFQPIPKHLITQVPLTILPILCVLLGGGIGASFRFIGITFFNWLYTRHYADIKYVFSHHTLFINVLGSFLMGLLATVFLQHHINALWRAAVLIGFLGGFTTVSSFSLETINNWRDKEYLLGTFYVILTVGLSGVFAALGSFIVGGY